MSKRLKYSGGASARGHARSIGPTSRGRKQVSRMSHVNVDPGYTRKAGYYGRFNETSRSAELKFHDLDLDDAVVASAGALSDSLNLIAQGTTEVTRIGRKCTIKSINWKYSWDLPATTASAAPPNGDVCRMIMYLDRQCNGATATVTGILETADFQSFNNLANSQRFLKLMDKTIVMNHKVCLPNNFTADTADFPQVVQSGSFYKKCDIPLEFNSTTGAITEIRSNNIGVILITKSGVAGFASKIRLRFTG